MAVQPQAKQEKPAPEQPLPPQYYFISHRKDRFMLRSTLGHSLTFEKGIPTHVPKALHSLAMERGLLPCDKDGKELDVAVAQEAVAQEAPRIEAPESAEERAEAILKVLKDIVKRNDPAMFGGNARPTVDAVKTALGWHTDAKEIQKVWEANRVELLTGRKAE